MRPEDSCRVTNEVPCLSRNFLRRFVCGFRSTLREAASVAMDRQHPPELRFRGTGISPLGKWSVLQTPSGIRTSAGPSASRVCS